MSENIPESIPTSADPRSKRPTKKARPTTTAGVMSRDIEALFAKQPEIKVPTSKGPKTAADLAPPPEIVANVQGSSAGAGSGEFHVYKAARRREYERQRLMDEEAKREEQDKVWKESIEAAKAKESAKTSKNRRRREKARENEKKKQTSNGGNGDTSTQKKFGLSANKQAASADSGRDDQEIAASALPEEQGITIEDDD